MVAPLLSGNGVALKAGNEENAVFIPLGEESKIQVTSIQGNDAPGGKGELAGYGDVSTPVVSDNGELREVAIVVQEQMELDSTLGGTILGPRK